MSTQDLGVLQRIIGIRHREFRLLYWLVELSCDGRVETSLEILTEKCGLTLTALNSTLASLSFRFPEISLRVGRVFDVDVVFGTIDWRAIGVRFQ